VSYETADALRTALEHRLGEYSRERGIALDRLRRRVVFERIVARLHAAEPGRWVVKGGMALEVRLRDGARLTKDLKLGAAVRKVWEEREGAAIPSSLPAFPASWPNRYEDSVAELGLSATSFIAAASIVTALWDGVVAREDPDHRLQTRG